MQNLPINFYVPYSADDEAWGLYLMGVGKILTPPNSEYPVGSHPPDYIFNFQKGRVLHEYQILYISEGSGVFDSKSSGKINVETGSIIILFPDEWHRYRPHRKTGWKESWIGFNGSIADQIMNSTHFSREEPIIKLGIRSRVNIIYDRVFDECKLENPGYQQLVAGLIMELLGLIQMLRKSTSFTNRHIQSQIYQSRRIIDVSYKEELDPKEIAEAVGMGYSNFRKHFRKLTGFSPSQYIIHLRLRVAKELLYNTNMTIKEVATKSGFNSSYYFIRMFKEKTGTTPRAYRLKARGLD